MFVRECILHVRAAWFLHSVLSKLSMLNIQSKARTHSAADISIPSRGLAAQSDEYADKAEELQAFQEKLSEGSLASGL